MQAYNVRPEVIAAIVDQARRDLKWSRVFMYLGIAAQIITGVVLLVGSFPSISQQGTDKVALAILLALVITLVSIPIGAYVWWSTYWGWVTIWRGFRRLMGGKAPGTSLPDIAFLFFIIFLMLILFEIASLYGILGGAIYQARKAKQIIEAAARLPIAR